MLNNDNQEFNADSFRKTCESLSKSANSRCGLFYELYCQYFSQSIDEELSNIPESFRNTALSIARQFDYCSQEELAQGRDDSSCRHGLHHDLCPHGCGEY